MSLHIYCSSHLVCSGIRIESCPLYCTIEYDARLAMWQAVFCGTIQALELAFITCFQQAYLGPTEPAIM